MNRTGFVRFLLLVAGPAAVLGTGIPCGAASARDDAAPDRAAAEAPAGPIVVERDRDPKQKTVCTTAVATGSIMSKRVCRTVAQIEAEQAATSRELERMQRDQDVRQQIRELCEDVSCEK